MMLDFQVEDIIFLPVLILGGSTALQGLWHHHIDKLCSPQENRPVISEKMVGKFNVNIILVF